MNNAASSMIHSVGRAAAPPKRQQSSRSTSSTDFLQTVKQASVSKNQNQDPPNDPDKSQGLNDDGNQANKPHETSKDPAKDTSKDAAEDAAKKDAAKDAAAADAGQGKAASLEAAMSETAGLLSNSMQNQIGQASQGQNQAGVQAQGQMLSALASSGKTAEALQSGQVKQTQAQTLGQALPFSQSAAETAKGLKTAQGKEASSDSKAVISLKTETAAMAKASEQKGSAGNAQSFGQSAGEKPVSAQSAAEALQSGKAAGGQTAEEKNLAQQGDSVHKTEKTPSDQTSKSGADSSVQAAGAPQEAKPSELVKIKVGEGPLNPQSQQFPQDVAKAVLRYSQDGKSQFDIQLTPKELGTIHIQLVFDKGTASVLMNCADPKTQNLLSLSTEQIRSIVQDETGLHTTVQLKEDQSSQNGRQDFDGRGENPQQDAQRQEQQQRRNQLEQELFSQQFRMEFQQIAAAGSAF